MGCFGSRLDKRASGAGEAFHSVGLQFHGGEDSQEWKLSADNFIVLKKSKDLQEIYATAEGKATDEPSATAAYKEAYTYVESLLKEHNDAVAKDGKAKTELIGGKFTRAECIDQLQNTFDSFKTSGIEVAAAVVAGKVDDTKVDGEADKEGGESECQYDGGDDEVKEVKPDETTAMESTDPRKKHVDDGKFEGFAETPALYLRNVLVNEFFGDMVKQRIIVIEFQGEKGLDTHKQLDGVAGFLTSGLATSAKTDADAWFSGCVGELDQASLSAMKKGDPIEFPGWIQGWASAEDAAGYLKAITTTDATKECKQVVIKATAAPTVSVLGNRLVSHRLTGTIESVATDETTFITTVTMTAKPWDARPLAASILAKEAKTDATTSDTKAVVPPPDDKDKVAGDDAGAGGDGK